MRSGVAGKSAPFDGMGSLLNGIAGKLARDPDAAPWSTEHLHLFLIYFTIVQIHLYQPENPDAMTDKYLSHTSQRLENFYLEVVAKSHPSEARLLADDLYLNKLSRVQRVREAVVLARE